MNQPSFLARIPLALRALFAILFDGAYALRVQQLDNPPPAPAPAPAPVPAPVPAPAPELKHADSASALQLLALLQRDARLLDFVHEDLRGHADADIGAAARLVHEGCGKVLREHFSLAPVLQAEEGSPYQVQAGYDAASLHVSGNVAGAPPFAGTLTHRGWQATDVRLPQLAAGHDTRILAQAEVEV
ncbi:DUF2760 domain-containing protein [Massilia sp. W12]|uniref:DUF2760 domain-containing protein n=1 Tax=Massilia sp. W12 TaxID=3126507 RepID=UPI0030CE131C